MSNYEKAIKYVRYCRDNDYTLHICITDELEGYVIYTAGGMRDFFNDWDIMIDWLAQRYDDEKEAGNI